MKGLVKDKKFLILIVCVNIFTIFTFIEYIYERKINAENIAVGRLSTEYEKEKVQRYGAVNNLSDELQQAAIDNNLDTDSDSKDNADNFDISDDKAIDKLIMNVTDLINNNDFSKILTIYNKDYVTEFKVNEDQIKDKFKFSPSVSPKITNIKRDFMVPDRAVVTVRLIDNKKAERIFDFTVFKDGTIADIPLYKEVELNKVMEKDDITYTLTKKFITRLGSIFILHIENNSEYLLDIKDIKGTIGTSLQFDHELINGNIHSYEITPQKKVDLIVKIDNEEKPDDILLTIQKVDGSIETFGILNKD
ncbi:hypothetical protein [uncultured Clostridium sp.]|uniref:hypothetical protein n=1 Tax=uncultured Clostridium sp. TaxID=59620 RepID=UPI0028E190C4|nr:hypothetical protein [uncultured Clostridium sp.]